MLSIAWCESRFNPQAKNTADAKITGYISWGIYQHNEPRFEGWDDPETNILKAKEKYDKRGLSPWTGSYDCWKNLPIQA